MASWRRCVVIMAAALVAAGCTGSPAAPRTPSPTRDHAAIVAEHGMGLLVGKQVPPGHADQRAIGQA